MDILPDDRAVYVGTLHYERNEFLQPTRFEVKDDYEAARALFEKKFGSGQALRKALAKPVNK